MSLYKILLVAVLYNFSVNAENCEQSICYQNVGKLHGKLLDSQFQFNKSVNSLGLIEINSLLDDLAKLENLTNSTAGKMAKSSKKLKKIKHQNEKNLESANVLEGKLKAINALNYSDDLYARLEEKYQEITDILALKRNTSMACNAAKHNVTQLKDGVKELQTQYKNFEDTLKQLNKQNMKDSFEQVLNETLRIKKELSTLRIPESVIAGSNSQLAAKLNQSYVTMASNIQILQDILEGFRANFTNDLKVKFTIVQNKTGQIQTGLDNINQLLKAMNNTIIYDKFNPTVDEKSLQLTEEIRKGLRDLESNIQALNLTEHERQILNKYDLILAQLEKDSQELRRYLAILDVLPLSNPKLRKIEKELQQLKQLLDVLETLDDLRNEVKILRKRRDEVLLINCTAVPTDETNILT